ncbi:DegV family protein [Thalassobacillus sp. CUG 92003]|uniref:DegV family protein n=1 Tax=Thalassobacillus sp. CUG 92003 TaxID=2736641 RepID=UPI0015E72C08|nr:DegV family protein [Thalassobacillus sp. CUG 92003]
MHIKILTDGGGDFPQSLIDEHQVKIIPLNIHFGQEQYKSGETIDLPTFYQKLKQSEELPSTSSPSPNEFYDAFKAEPADLPLLVLSLSQGLSSTYESAVMGKNMLLEEEPDRQIAVLNTKTASSGMALLVQEAADKIQEGYDFDPLVAHMEDKIEHTATLFILKTLENVIKGGRLDKVKGTIAKTLNIKLLMRSSEEGSIEVTEKVRGDKKSIRRFVDQIGEYAHQFEDKMIALTHCNDEERGKSVLDAIKNRYAFKDSIFTETGPVISTYAGEGGLVIAFFKD